MTLIAWSLMFLIPNTKISGFAEGKFRCVELLDILFINVFSMT